MASLPHGSFANLLQLNQQIDAWIFQCRSKACQPRGGQDGIGNVIWWVGSAIVRMAVCSVMHRLEGMYNNHGAEYLSNGANHDPVSVPSAAIPHAQHSHPISRNDIYLTDS